MRILFQGSLEHLVQARVRADDPISMSLLQSLSLTLSKEQESMRPIPDVVEIMLFRKHYTGRQTLLVPGRVLR